MRIIKSEVYFPIIIGVHLVLWAVDLAMHDGSFALVEGESPVQRVLGEIMSSWVITVFGFNLLMITRLKWVERIFGGLDKMFLIHRRSGVIVAVLLLLHFGTVPRHPEFSFGKPLGFAAMTLILLGVAFATAPVMKRKLPYHKWVLGHRVMGIFYLVGIAHAMMVPTLISELPLIRTYVIAMAGLGVASWFYRVFLFRIIRKPLQYKVTSVRRFGQSVVDIRMTPEGPPLRYEAGQFAFFSFAEHSPIESHPFTIAGTPSNEEIRIVVKASGDFTNDLVGTVREGDIVRVEGPYGHLSQRHIKSTEQVWIAGGIGITPFLSLAQTLARTGKKATLIWSVRSEEEAFFDQELRAVAQEHESFEYKLWNSHDQGYLSVEGAGGPEVFQDADVVICGPPALRDNLTAQLRKTGTRSGQIHSEEFSFR